MEFKTKLRVARQGDAFEKWRIYKDAFKRTKDPMSGELAQAFFYIRKNYTVIEIGQAIRAGGVHYDKPWWPKLGIAPHHQKYCFCHFKENGTVVYNNQSYDPSWRISGKHSMSWRISIDHCFEPIPASRFSNGVREDLVMKAPVPMMPPGIKEKAGAHTSKPGTLNANHYILFEVEKWEERTAPPDPALLRRISPHFFIVEATWDLSSAETAAMEAYLR